MHIIWIKSLDVLLAFLLNALYRAEAVHIALPSLNNSYLPTSCTDDPSWFTPDLKKRDCFAAWNEVRLDVDRSGRRGRREFQFIRWGSRTARDEYPQEFPPIRFTHGM